MPNDQYGRSPYLPLPVGSVDGASYSSGGGSASGWGDEWESSGSSERLPERAGGSGWGPSEWDSGGSGGRGPIERVDPLSGEYADMRGYQEPERRPLWGNPGPDATPAERAGYSRPSPYEMGPNQPTDAERTTMERSGYTDEQGRRRTVAATGTDFAYNPQTGRPITSAELDAGIMPVTAQQAMSNLLSPGRTGQAAVLRQQQLTNHMNMLDQMVRSGRIHDMGEAFRIARELRHEFDENKAQKEAEETELRQLNIRRQRDDLGLATEAATTQHQATTQSVQSSVRPIQTPTGIVMGGVDAQGRHFVVEGPQGGGVDPQTETGIAVGAHNLDQAREGSIHRQKLTLAQQKYLDEAANKKRDDLAKLHQAVTSQMYQEETRHHQLDDQRRPLGPRPHWLDNLIARRMEHGERYRELAVDVGLMTPTEAARHELGHINNLVASNEERLGRGDLSEADRTAAQAQSAALQRRAVSVSARYQQLRGASPGQQPSAGGAQQQAGAQQAAPGVNVVPVPRQQAAAEFERLRASAQSLPPAQRSIAGSLLARAEILQERISAGNAQPTDAAEYAELRRRFMAMKNPTSAPSTPSIQDLVRTNPQGS